MSIEHYCPGAPFMRSFRWPIPQNVFDNYYVEFRMGVSVTAVYAAMQKTYSEMLVRIKGLNVAGAPPILSYAKRFGVADGLEPGKWRKVSYILSGSRMIGKEGGTLTWWFNTLSQSTGPDFLVDEYHLMDHWGPHAEGMTIA